MKKYTVVYAIFYGNYGATMTKFLHIECEPQFIKSEVERHVNFGNVWFIFDGHCEQTED